MHSIEHVREFLETEIGDEILMKVYPLLLEIGDNVFIEENLVHQALEPYMSTEKVQKYLPFLTTLIFFEKQSEVGGGGLGG